MLIGKSAEKSWPDTLLGSYHEKGNACNREIYLDKRALFRYEKIR
jgi:hypothetical protein